MSKLSYKIDTFITKLKFKIGQSSKLKKILSNKILFVIVLIIFIISFGTYSYFIITNSHHGFQRWFNQNIYKISHIDKKISYISLFSGIFLFIKLLLSNFFQNILQKNYSKIINIHIFNFLLYIGTIFLFTSELKTKVLAIITPLVLYGIYKIHNYIDETKSRYKFKFLIDSRYLFLIALILLIYTPIFIYFNDKKIAESLSIYAYYALIIGVIYEIISSKFEK